MSKHTPGPWLVESDPMHFDTLSTVVGGVKKKARGINRQMIVQVGGWAEWREQEANARLIAAAPSLLAACIKTIEANRHLADGDNCTLIELVHAVEQATGSRP